ncbi:hypothetical protein [Deinococcus sp. 6GRE01]|uniref:hypothetical protein n=1 Tax=Deinococcus sp. 6GRE01 TaxID=2745873 RepID=UPI001E38F3C3|nr:hypothetical protein [Deinococcus sp. 6GRE01]MCD0156000.1 hypothetical protein [Deinococcus sp. 6GRE01]
MQSEMVRQTDEFMAHLPTLLNAHAGQMVGWWDGRVIATGDSVREVLDRVDAVRGTRAPVLVRRVQADYPPIEL